MTDDLTLTQVADRAGVSTGTLRRWAETGVIPGFDGAWTPAHVAHARMVARLRARGHSLAQIRRATDAGRLAFAYTEHSSRTTSTA